MTASTAQPASYTVGHVTSSDGTRIGYRRYGHGPGLVLVQGSMGSVENFKQLAELLAGDFTVYAAERRGRGISGPTGDDYSIQKEVNDLDAVLDQTGARCVFGLSSGAIFALQAALSLPAIEKLAVFEPPVFTSSTLPVAQLRRYEREMADGKVAAALVTAMRVGQFGPGIMRLMPNWLLVALVKRIMVAEAAAGSGDYLPRTEHASTLRNDFQLIEAMTDNLHAFEPIQAKLLLLNGDKSPGYLETATNALARLLPQAEHVVLPGLSHAAPWNYDRQRNPHGKPEAVAVPLRQFFSA